ncbi:hypothetical protein HHK36_000899 [Tetracentron sinense]|uniref:Uncharacterized protein n=1 Tax=Tetracentron sinense TaxID=13715 RepID=A0A835A2N0_TETSI|nr:hypothetical protein HHK36_000899 [Tetracentron sinense]
MPMAFWQIVYDVTGREGFNNVKQWLNDQKFTHWAFCVPCLWLAFAVEIGIPFMKTSAKTATNVEQAFMATAAEIKNSRLPCDPPISHLVYLFIYFYCRKASHPVMNNVRPPMGQLRGQPVAQKSGCC